MKSFPGRLKLKSAQHQSTHHQCCDASWQRAGAICPVSLNKSSIIHLVFIIGTWVRFFFYSVTAVVRSSLAGVEIIAAITLARFRPHAMSTTHGSIHLLAERVRVRAALPLHHNVVRHPVIGDQALVLPCTALLARGLALFTSNIHAHASNAGLALEAQ